jgi:glycosyltransferase involved in cell wall biosynthesis
MSKHLRVLIDARPLVDPRGGGVRRVAEQVVQSILESELDAEWFFVTTGLKKPVLPEWITDHQNTQHVHIKWPNKLWSLAAMFGAVALDRETAKQLPAEEDRPKKFDKAIILNLGFTGFLETPYALLLHDLSFRINPEWFSFKSRLWHIAVNPKEILRRAQQLFSVSETTARDAARIFGIPVKKIEIVKPGVRPEKREARGETLIGNLESSYALVLGSGNPRKNVPTVIKAFEILKRDPEFANVELIIVGEREPSRALGERARQRRAPTPYTLHPTPSDSELDDLYANAAMFLYPSWYEGYGLPLHEAARFEIPCIASTDGALPETAPEGTMFVPPSKPHLWANAIRDVLASPDRYPTTFDVEIEKPDFASLIHWLGRQSIS